MGESTWIASRSNDGYRRSFTGEKDDGERTRRSEQPMRALIDEQRLDIASLYLDAVHTAFVGRRDLPAVHVFGGSGFDTSALGQDRGLGGTGGNRQLRSECLVGILLAPHMGQRGRRVSDHVGRIAGRLGVRRGIFDLPRGSLHRAPFFRIRLSTNRAAGGDRGVAPRRPRARRDMIGLARREQTDPRRPPEIQLTRSSPRLTSQSRAAGASSRAAFGRFPDQALVEVTDRSRPSTSVTRAR